MTPAIDKQEEIYKDIMAYVDAAIEDLQKSHICQDRQIVSYEKFRNAFCYEVLLFFCDFD